MTVGEFVFAVTSEFIPRATSTTIAVTYLKNLSFLIHYLFIICLISQNEVIEVFTSTHPNQVILLSIEQV